MAKTNITKPLTQKSLAPKYPKLVTTQDYSPKPKIEGVEFFELKTFVGEDGDFCELIRLDPSGRLQLIPGFQVLQVNRSLMFPGSIKAWHIHFNQEDVWYIPPTGSLLVGLIDLRKQSPTKNVQMKFTLGGGKSQLLYIPRGVAHGAANVSPNHATIIYFINQHFNPQKPDEHRLPWDTFGNDFWQPTKE